MRVLLLTTMLILAGCGLQQPPRPPKSAAEIAQLIDIADKALVLAQKTHERAPAEDVQEATREFRAALDVARAQTDEIVRQVAGVSHLAPGAIDPMGVSSCINTHLIEVQDIENMHPTTLTNWSMDVGQCAAFAIVYFNTAPPADGSTLALGLHIIDPIMLAARSRSGLKKGALVHYLDSNQSIIAKLGPACGEKTGSAANSPEVSYRCAAYRVAMAMQPKLQRLQQVQLTP